MPHEKEIHALEKSINQFKEQNSKYSVLDESELLKLEEKIDKLKKKVYSDLTPWEKVTIARHPQRPRSIDYINALCGNNFVEICGDRLYGNDPAIITGIGTINGEKFVIIGQEKGRNTEERVQRNFGMPHPEGFRKALRAMKMAEKFGIPVLSFVDTTGAYPGLEAEERGQSWAIAENLLEMSRLKTQMIVLIIGEGASGGALGVGMGDAIGILEYSYFSVITPEGCASILWKDTSKTPIATEALKLTAQDMLEYGIVDHIVSEPLGGAHHNPEIMFANVKNYVVQQIQRLKTIPITQLLDNRYTKYRKMGRFQEVATSDILEN